MFGTGDRSGGGSQRALIDRLNDLVEHRLLPALRTRGFDRDASGAVVSRGDGVDWLLGLSLAPWSDDRHLCFSIEWEVHVPGLDELFDDAGPGAHGSSAVVEGAVKDGFGSAWFELRRQPALVTGFTDGVLARKVLKAFDLSAAPTLESLDTVTGVQAHLHDGLVTGRGVPHDDELRTIRRIAALSALLGDRANAARWVDYLEIRSSAAIAPDVVAERLAPLRQRLAS
jgi:hypothetical protein